MWKATATLDQNSLAGTTPQSDDLDWDSDPNFVNQISEKDQRWGKQKTIVDNSTVDVVSMAGISIFNEDFRQKIVQSNDQQSKEQWLQKSNDTKKSYGVQKA
jgi:hypothetical protein